MANQINTVEEILTFLNRDLPDQQWQQAPSLYKIDSATIDNGQINSDSESIALKIFVNIRTGEVRTYIAKWLNIPETTSLK